MPSASERKTLFFTSFGIELTLGSVSVITDPSRQPRCPRIGSVMRRPFAGPREFGAVLIWGIEDSRHLSARLEIDLLLALRQMMHNVPAAAL